MDDARHDPEEGKGNGDPRGNRARWPFRVLAGIAAIVSLAGVLSLLFRGLGGGRLKDLTLALSGLAFGAEFASIAIRGDGLWLRRSDRFSRAESRERAEDE